MKRLHRPDLYGWSVFDKDRNIDFHGLCWVRAEGNVLVDPMPMSEHDRTHLDSLGGCGFIIVTNSDHTRAASMLAEAYDAKIAGPKGEQSNFPLKCDEWLDDGDEPVEGLRVYAMAGSKTPGELALVLEHSTLICGDLIRAHEGGRLCLLPKPKLADASTAAASVRRLANIGGFQAVLPGDGWPIFRHGDAALRELAAELE